jgi:hypothetical protein
MTEDLQNRDVRTLSNAEKNAILQAGYLRSRATIEPRQDDLSQDIQPSAESAESIN